MHKVIMMIGLPGSGKSSLGKKLEESEDAVMFSSDEIGFEMRGEYRANEGKVLVELRTRIANRLKEGNAIYDAANISSKKRMGALDQLRNCSKECYFLSVPASTCIQRDQSRTRQVGSGRIWDMQASLQIPVLREGWEKIYIIHEKDPQSIYYEGQREKLEKLILSETTHESLFGGLKELKPFQDIYNLPQDSTYHTFSVSRHTYYVYQHLFNTYHEEDRLAVLWAAIFHDTGKYATKKFRDEHRYASFIGHENVSAQLALNHLISLGYPEEFAMNVALICQLHMRLLQNQENQKVINKLIDFYGQDMYDKLVLFREADTQAK